MTQQINETVNMASSPPTGIQVVLREFKKDKVAMFSLVGVTLIIISIFITAWLLDQESVLKINLFERYTEPGENGYILGADEAGRDVLGQLVIGAKNSLLIAIWVTIITNIIGIALGIIMGYYSGIVDNVMMRIIDFIITLPTFMIFIVLVSIIPE